MILPKMLTLLGAGGLAAWISTAPASPEANRALPPHPDRVLLVVVGAAGGEPFQTRLEEWRRQWEDLAERTQSTIKIIGTNSPPAPRNLLEQYIRRYRTSAAELWIVLLGHGTYNGESARFNLEGPDVSAKELADWVDGHTGRLIVVNAASCSAPFLNRLSGPKRVIITATRSGFEQSFPHFGGFFVQALAGLEGDRDRDGQTSLLEAFLHAAAQVEAYYQNEDRLLTEHALIDDNGDSRGTPAAWFQGVRPERKSESNAEPDGFEAHQIHLIPSPEESQWTSAQRSLRSRLERQLNQLRATKPDLSEAEYYVRLEFILVELAHLYEDAGRLDEPNTEPPTTDKKPPGKHGVDPQSPEGENGSAEASRNPGG